MGHALCVPPLYPALITFTILGRSTPVVGPALRVPPLCPALISRSVGYRLSMKKGRRSKQRYLERLTICYNSKIKY